MEYCYICYSTSVFTSCERCERLFCEECSAKITYHNFITHDCCLVCASQSHYPTLQKIRDNKLKIINE